MSVMKELLLIHSFGLGALIEEYRIFFLSLLPSVFILAVIIEYFDRLGPVALVKRAFISILVLTTITGFYHQAIDLSLETADEILATQKSQNILLMDMLDGNKHWNDLLTEGQKRDFIKEEGVLSGSFSFLKHHLFNSFINDSFTVTVYFITQLCFVILKVVYSLVYYLGYGLIGIPCLIYLFPSMGNVLRGAIVSFLWCLTVPHVLVFVLSLIGSEINKGYSGATIIGGSIMGTAFLFVMTLFIAFTPLIAMMILNGSGVAQAGGVISTIGGNYVMNLPRNTVSSAATLMAGGSLGPVTSLLKQAVQSKNSNTHSPITRDIRNQVMNSAFNQSSGSSSFNSQSSSNTAPNNRSQAYGKDSQPNMATRSMDSTQNNQKQERFDRESERRSDQRHPDAQVPRASHRDSGHRETNQENNVGQHQRQHIYSRPWSLSSSDRNRKR